MLKQKPAVGGALDSLPKKRTRRMQLVFVEDSGDEMDDSLEDSGDEMDDSKASILFGSCSFAFAGWCLGRCGCGYDLVV
jgi:hypothetical protein